MFLRAEARPSGHRGCSCSSPSVISDPRSAVKPAARLGVVLVLGLIVATAIELYDFGQREDALFREMQQDVLVVLPSAALD
jgi:hypothetical protein